ncbi:MAG TPA: glycosyl hydrolase, partial [Tepidisphaeraceae bacterium]|nr:glycosyl hydrolase [Tepidisphaeraceae bacterium]
MAKRLSIIALFLLLMTSIGYAADPLSDGFRNPPDSAKPQTWWHWMNGNVTKEGITADLESMNRVGVGGAEIFVAAEGIPAGPVKFNSPEFLDMMKHAASEADRLGLELCFHNCAGWSSSGGPWNTPEHAMQFLESSETHVKGPAKYSEILPQPPTRLNFYRDVVVLAYRRADQPAGSLPATAPKVLTSADGIDGSKVVDGDANSEVMLPRPSSEKPQFVELILDQPLAARSIVITPGKGILSCGGEVQSSDDGVSFHALHSFDIAKGSTHPVAVSLGEKPAVAKFFRVLFSRASANVRVIPLAEVQLSTRAQVENAQLKAGYLSSAVQTQTSNTSTDGAVRHEDMVDLTDKLGPDGKLTWDVPEGDWTIQRIGYSPTGRENHPAPPEGTGPECDKFSTEALDAHWAGYPQKVLDALGPLAGKTLNDCLIDSYEVGGQNWTPKMREEFQKRRGYDPTRYLPAMSGVLVDSPEISERFLWDIRRTIADLFADNYYGHFADLCHAHGLKASIEPYSGPYESLLCGKPADIVMGEFWSGSHGDPSIKLASSVAHIYGKQLVGAESFTARPPTNGRWQEDPYSLKALGDRMFCDGINRLIFHRFAHQPWLDRYPGMTMGQWGFHFDRTNTWFEQSTAWIKYLARCQYLLQQGRFVADVAYLDGESAPIETQIGKPPMPAGFDYDDINADVLMSASAKDGRIVLSGGMSYAALVLPPNSDLMRPPLLHKIRDLVNEGATVIGPKPRRSPSLQDYPKCDQEVEALSNETWGDCDGKSITQHSLGKGKVVSGKSLAECFAGKLQPDFESPSDSSEQFVYIHRAVDDTDIYFVSNQKNDFVKATCTFRVTGKVPQLWHADTGVTEAAPVWSDSDGRTTVPLRFDPSGSVFVIFTKTDSSPAHLTQVAPSPDDLITSSDGQIVLSAWNTGAYDFQTSAGQTKHVEATEAPKQSEVAGPWELRFPPNWGAPPSVTLEKLISWPTHSDPGVKYFSGTATYIKTLDITPEMLLPDHALYLDLGKVKNLAQVKLNDKDLGILWKPPFRVRLNDIAKAG